MVMHQNFKYFINFKALKLKTSKVPEKKKNFSLNLPEFWKFWNWSPES